MRIWIVTVGEPLPIDGAGPRLLRNSLLSKALLARGHTITRWDSAFNHAKKTFRCKAHSCIHLEDQLILRLMHAPAYRKNVSFGRLRNHRGLARAFRELTSHEPRPDIILASLPIIELCDASVRYGRKHNVPVVIDVRDMWPDIFLEQFPVVLRPAARMLLSPIFRSARNALGGAAAILGHAPAFVEWGLDRAGRQSTPLDAHFPHGYSAVPPPEDAVKRAQDFWKAKGVGPDRADFIACFAGAFGRQFDMETVTAAARHLEREPGKFLFVLCGSGPRLEECRRAAANAGNVVFPGWVEAPEIWTLMRMSQVGLAPYRSTPSFRVSMPNKPIEFFSAGLPVVSSLEGALQSTLEANRCGITYEPGNARSLSQALTRLSRTPTVLEEMSRNALTLFRGQYVAEDVYTLMAEHLERVAAAH